MHHRYIKRLVLRAAEVRQDLPRALAGYTICERTHNAQDSWTSTLFVDSQGHARYYSWPSRGIYRADKLPCLRIRSSQSNPLNTPRNARSEEHPKHDHKAQSLSQYANDSNFSQPPHLSQRLDAKAPISGAQKSPTPDSALAPRTHTTETKHAHSREQKLVRAWRKQQHVHIPSGDFFAHLPETLDCYRGGHGYSYFIWPGNATGRVVE